MEQNKKDGEFWASGEREKESPKMEIEINQYKHLVEAFNNPKSLAKIIIVVAIIICLVFLGISGVALIVKKFYPYNTLKSNKYGATVIQNEDGDVTYWLFNSADLWANSGIEVKKGETISIRTSGAFNTAVHRLVEAARENKVADKWLSPTGGMPSEGRETGIRDDKRADHRISKTAGADFNVILMQVLPKGLDKLGCEWYKEVYKKKMFNHDSAWWSDHIDGGMPNEYSTANIYVIGQEQENIEIQEDGVLYFACNDIVLTPRKIDTMLKDTHMVDTTFKFNGKERIGKLDTGKYRLGPHPTDPLKTELEYYRDSNYINAWYDDNVGSFLIVVERKNRQ